MKPVEEWLKNWSFGADTKTDVIDLINQIQQDAYAAGAESQIKEFSSILNAAEGDDHVQVVRNIITQRDKLLFRCDSFRQLSQRLVTVLKPFGSGTEYLPWGKIKASIGVPTAQKLTRFNYEADNAISAAGDAGII